MAYNQRILESTSSVQRQHRAERMLANLQPHLERLRAEEAERLRRIASAAPPASSFEGQLQRRVRDCEEDGDFETVWDGTKDRERTCKPLTDAAGLGSSLAGAEFLVRS